MGDEGGNDVGDERDDQERFGGFDRYSAPPPPGQWDPRFTREWWTAPGTASPSWSTWPYETAEERQRRRASRHVRTAAASLVALALLLAGMAAGISVATRPRGNGSTPEQLATGGAVPSRDHGIVDVQTILGYQQARAAGTGIVLTSTGEILTNNHVVEGATSVSVTDVTTGRTYAATVVGTDPTADVAVIQLRGATGLRVARLGSSSDLQVGEPVTALGNAGGVGGLPHASTGDVTALHQQITAGSDSGEAPEQLTDMIQTSATLEPGDSGGPLLDSSNRVVGMDTAAGQANGFSATENFAIPINRALSVAGRIEAGQGSTTVHIGPSAFLGVQIGPGGTDGADIMGVIPGTPAAAIGLAAGDLITSVDGQPVTSGNALSTVLDELQVGATVRITWVESDGTAAAGKATLIKGPAA